ANPQQIADALEAVDGGAGVTVKLLDLKTESDHLLNGYRHEALLLVSLGTVAMLTFDHHRLSIFNLFGLLLVVAVGSNYCLFFQRGGMIGEEGARMATSLLLANTCTVIGFGALALSHIPVLYGIGSTVAIGTALSLVAAAILTPGFDTAQHEARQ